MLGIHGSTMTSQPPTEEQKYAVFSPLSVQIYAESIGLPILPDDILSRLAEDVSYRVREVVSKSCEFMRCSRRKKLKSTDVDRALKWSNVSPMSGVGDSLSFESVEGIYYTEDPVMDLKEMALGDVKPIQRCPISMSKKWLPHLCLPETPSTGPDTGKFSNGNISGDQQHFDSYYTSLVECILSDNDALFELILNDIRTNPRIGPIISYFVSFLSAANVVSHDLTKLSRMLFVLKALLANHYISIQLYLKPLLKAVIYCVVEPLAASINPLNDHWLVRDYGAILAAELIYRHATEVDALLEHTHSVICDILHDTTRPLCSHYGAIILTARLGVVSIRKLLSPIMANYVTAFLQPIMEDISFDNVHMKNDAQMVFGACMVCIERLHYKTIPDIGLKFCFPNLSSEITDLFGDALSVRLPLHALSKVKEEESKNSVSNVTLSWQHYSLSTGSGFNVKLPSKRRKMLLKDIFLPTPQLRRYTPIRIAFGVQRPHTYRKHISKTDSQYVAAQHRLHLVRRIVTAPKRTAPCGVLAWL